ncbi:MAG TPA: M43 family zinc metalloprotease [Puia sp.]
MILLAFTLSSKRASAQTFTCGQAAATESLKARNPDFQAKLARSTADWRNYQRTRTKQPAGPSPLGASVVTLPVVVHVVHDNGPENISDAQVQTAIQHLNEAYANIGYYNPADGVDTHIQFCLAQRDPDNQPTNGITHDVSPYTNMSDGSQQEDLNVKNVRRWDPFHYINIWVIRSIPGAVAGYAYHPAAHGSDFDGIVLEAQYFGVTEAYDVVVIHEMGHYLGLYHTFEGGCTNNDCSLDGDHICDTPPDQSTSAIGCNQAMNSCSTDALSGFSDDENDLTKDYMDYGNVNCMTIFTPDQSELMNWSIQNIRTTLLNTRSCMPPCPAPVTAAFDLIPGPLVPGSTIAFTNQSVNAAAYTWSVNGTQQSTAADFSYTLPATGFYTIRLLAASGNPLCADAEKDTLLRVLCPATAAFTPPDTTIVIGSTAHYAYTGANATTWQWSLDGTITGAAPTYDANFSAVGDHTIHLVVTDGHCSSEAFSHLKVVDPADSCSIHTFQKTMLGTTGLQVAWESAVDPGGNYIISGLTNSGGGASPSGLVVKMDPTGTPLWAEKIGGNHNARIYSGKTTTDGGSIHAGSEAGPVRGAATLTKLDGQGRLQWAKTYTHPTSSISIYPQVLPLSAGGYAVSSTVSGFTLPLLIFRTDDAGNLLWAKNLFNNALIAVAGMLEDNGRLIVAVQASFFTGPGFRGVIFALDEATGNFIWGKYYDVPGSDVATEKLYAYQGNYLVSVLYNNQYGTLMIDKQGNPLSAFVAQDANSISPVEISDLAIAADQTITLVGNETDATSQQDATLINITADGKLIMARKYPQPRIKTLYSIRATSDKGYFTAGSITGTGVATGFYFLKTDSALRLFRGESGGADCPVIPFTPAITPLAVTATPFTFTPSTTNMVAADDQPTITPFSAPLTSYCQDPAACSLLAIIGRDTACSAHDSLVLTARRNPGCNAKLTWTLDDPTTTITQPTDSTVRLQFTQSGRRLLRANMISGCQVFTDSAWLTVPATTDTINLGPDIALCTQSTIRLSAGTGYRSYLWQDGTTDSTLTPWLPGAYWVVATDYCNSTHSDTITITNTAPPDFHLGPNQLLCQGDSLKLSAPAGFDSYHWSPEYRLSDPTAANTYTSPLTDTTYTCTAIKGAGCAVTDSIRIKVDLCHKGLYFPGAFTPNKDGANDVWRPVIIGALPLEYRLSIYNRDGQLVFTTRDPAAGWDGRVRDIPAVNNAFLWWARYRLPGEPERLDKGVLILVR